MNKCQNKDVQKKKRKKKCNQNNFSTCNKENNNSNNQTSKLCSFGYVDYMVLASTLAIALGDELNSNDLSILASFFATLSDELALITSVKNCNSNTPDDIFVPPIPDIAVTCSTNKTKKSKKIKHIKKK